MYKLKVSMGVLFPNIYDSVECTQYKSCRVVSSIRYRGVLNRLRTRYLPICFFHTSYSDLIPSTIIHCVIILQTFCSELYRGNGDYLIELMIHLALQSQDQSCQPERATFLHFSGGPLLLHQLQYYNFIIVTSAHCLHLLLILDAGRCQMSSKDV